MEKIFTEKQVNLLNEKQQSGKVHPYTCDRKSVNCQVKFNKGDGILLATTYGWICPCKDYKQTMKQFKNEEVKQIFDKIDKGIWEAKKWKAKNTTKKILATILLMALITASTSGLTYLWFGEWQVGLTITFILYGCIGALALVGCIKMLFDYIFKS